MRISLPLAGLPALLAAGFLAAGLGAGRAEPALLFDVRTGEVLAHQEAFRRWHPASLTKLMTAYAVFRAIDAGEATLDSPIRMTRHAASMPPAKMGFKAGSVLTLDNALKSIMVKSANDVAMAIGENVGGSERGFARRMNAEAARLGMTGSHWVNPNGLHDPEQYTTAHDLALLVRAIRTEYPQYAPYFSIDGLVVGKKVIKTFNTLMGRYPGADGMKTGFVCPSGFNLVGTATRDGRTLAAVVLGAVSPEARAEEATEMLDAGFVPALPKPIAASAMATPTQAPAPVTLASMQPYGAMQDVATDMREVVCSAKPKKEQPASAQPSEAAAPTPEDTGLPGHQPRLEVVALGGATGPVPKAMLDASGQIKADVPLPAWRPDRDPPPGSRPLASAAPAALRAAKQALRHAAANAVPAAVPLGFSEPIPERFGGPLRLRPTKSPS